MVREIHEVIVRIRSMFDPRGIIESTKRLADFDRQLRVQRDQLGRFVAVGRKKAETIAIWRDQYGRIAPPARTFSEVMAMSMESVRAVTPEIYRNMTAAGRLAYVIRTATHGLRGFRMEFLSVMFFGMQVQRTFIGLLRPAMELTGIFKLFSSVLGILFLPVALMMLKVLMPIFLWFMKLGEGTKKIIGLIVLFIGVLFTIIMTVGMFGLGIGGLIMVFGKLGVALAMFVPLIVTIIAVITAIILIIKNWGEITEWLTNVWDRFSDWIGGLWDDIRDKASAIWAGIVSILSSTIAKIKGIFSALKGFLISIWAAIKSAASTIWEGIKNTIIRIILGLRDAILGIFRDILPAFYSFGRSIVLRIIDGIRAIGGLIARTIWGLIPSPVRGIVRGILYGFLPAFQYGGIVPGPIGAPVPIIAHGGERFLGPRGGGSTIYFAPTIYVEATVTKDVDVDELKDKLSEGIIDQLDSLLRER